MSDWYQARYPGYRPRPSGVTAALAALVFFVFWGCVFGVIYLIGSSLLSVTLGALLWWAIVFFVGYAIGRASR